MRTALLLLVLLAACPGCVAFQHGWGAVDYQGLVLDASKGPGAERLQVEMDYDPTVRTFIRAKGKPDTPAAAQ